MKIVLNISIRIIFVILFLSPNASFSAWYHVDIKNDCKLDETKKNSGEQDLIVKTESCKKNLPKLEKAANSKYSEISCFYVGGTDIDDIIKYRIERNKVYLSPKDLPSDILYRSREKIIFNEKNVEISDSLKDFNIEVTINTIQGTLNYHITWKENDNTTTTDDRFKLECNEK